MLACCLFIYFSNVSCNWFTITWSIGFVSFYLYFICLRFGWWIKEKQYIFFKFNLKKNQQFFKYSIKYSIIKNVLCYKKMYICLISQHCYRKKIHDSRILNVLVDLYFTQWWNPAGYCWYLVADVKTGPKGLKPLRSKRHQAVDPHLPRMASSCVFSTALCCSTTSRRGTVTCSLCSPSVHSRHMAVSHDSQ